MITCIYTFSATSHLSLPIFLNPVRAGFPSPAEDYLDGDLDLNRYLVNHPAATFYVRVSAEGDSMTGAGIFPGDILVVDRSLDPRPGQVVIAVIDGEFTVKHFRRKGSKVFLEPANPKFSPIEITPGTPFEVWGVVTHTIHKV